MTREEHVASDPLVAKNAARVAIAGAAVRLTDMERMQGIAHRYSIVRDWLIAAGCPIVDGCHVTVVKNWLESLGLMRRERPSEPPRYGYSYDEENYHGRFATIAEALGAAADDDDVRACYVCECARPPGEELIDADLVIDAITSAEEYSLEAAENWPRVTPETKQELTDALRRVIGEWLDKHRLRDAFYLAENVRRYEFRDGRWHESKEGM